MRKIISYVLLVTMLLSLCLTGCGTKEKGSGVSEKDGTVVFRFGDDIVTLGEVYIYVCSVKERYENQYGADVWQLSLPDDAGEQVSMVDLTRQEVVENITKVKTLVRHADEYKVSIDEEEDAKISSDAETFFKGLTDEDVSSMELSYDKVYQVMKENAIADKVWAALEKENPIELSDEQTRMTTFYDMYFPCYSIDENGVVTKFSEEDKDVQYENALQACSTLATANLDEDKDAENIEKLAEYYELDQAKEQTMEPATILETYGQDVYDLLYSMENGDYSTVIESEYGYHVFEMIALTDQKATQSNKEVMTKKAMEQQLASTLADWEKAIDSDFSYPLSVDMELYNKIELK